MFLSPGSHLVIYADNIYFIALYHLLLGCLYSLDWTTRPTFDLILGVLCKLIHNSYCGFEHFLCLKQYNSCKLQQCLHRALQLCRLPSDCLEKSIFTLETASLSYMLINNNSYNSVVAIDRFCSYLKQVQQLRQTTPMPLMMEIAHQSIIFYMILT